MSPVLVLFLLVIEFVGALFHRRIAYCFSNLLIVRVGQIDEYHLSFARADPDRGFNRGQQ